MKQRLIDVYSPAGHPWPIAVDFLYKMLGNRDPTTSISHERMPEFKDHVAFLSGRPYKAWYIIEDISNGTALIGNIYLTERDEIGVHITGKYRRLGIGTWAVNELMRIHGKRRYYANIHPMNDDARYFFNAMGFQTPVQTTYMLDTREPTE